MTTRDAATYGTKARQRHADEARDRLTRAAAAMTQWWEADNLAYALMESGRAMLAISKADPEFRARDRVLAACDATREASHVR